MARTARRTIDRAISEASFQDAVVELAETCGWRVMHVRRSRVRGDRWATATSVTGWPDCVILGHNRALFVELKSQRGRVSDEQSALLAELRDAGLDARLWRPSDWPEIEATLNPRGAR
jgi:hypothetical protein